MPRRLGAWALALAGVVALIVAGLRLMAPEPVATVTLETHEISRVLVVVGFVRPPSTARLGVAVPGVVTTVGPREGDTVTAGQVLVRLEDGEARATVRQAEARIAEVSALVRSEIERAELELSQAELDLARTRSVVAAGGLTRQRLDQAEQRVGDARSRLDAARADLESSETSAVVEGAQAALEAARARLALTRIVAPTDGLVLRRMVEPGDAVQPGLVLLEVATDGLPELVAYPSEENLAGLRVGAQARVSADAFPADTFAATVARVGPAVDPTQGTVEVRLQVDDPPAYLRPDMTLSINIELERRAGARVLDAAAVRDLGSTAPWVAVVRDGRIERRPVSLGILGRDLVEVHSGLEAGERVVLGREELEPGARVRTEE